MNLFTKDPRNYNKGSLILMLFYLIALLVIVMDQLSKLWIRIHLKIGDSIEIWKDVLHFTHYENSGAAFSSFQGYGRFFVPIAVLIVATILHERSKGHLKGFVMEMGTALLVGGASGNAIDRVLFNQVTDFIQFHFSHGILNLADYAINLGIVLILIDLIIIHPNQTRKTVDSS